MDIFPPPIGYSATVWIISIWSSICVTHWYYNDDCIIITMLVRWTPSAGFWKGIYWRRPTQLWWIVLFYDKGYGWEGNTNIYLYVTSLFSCILYSCIVVYYPQTHLWFYHLKLVAQKLLKCINSESKDAIIWWSSSTKFYYKDIQISKGNYPAKNTWYIVSIT